MIKYFLTSTAVLALISGVAVAQSLSGQTTVTSKTTITTPPPVADTVHTTKTQQKTDSDGTQTDKSQTFSSGANGTTATATSRTTAPDGTPIATAQREHVVAPNGDTTTTNRTTTTTPNPNQ